MNPSIPSSVFWQKKAFLVSVGSAFAISILLAGCHEPSRDSSKPSDVGPQRAEALSTNDASSKVKVSYGMMANPLESSNVMRVFSAQGVIRSFSAEGDSVVIRHDEIPGFMPRMTMEFSVHDTNELRGLKVGDAIVFQVRANQTESWIDGIRRSGSNDLSSALSSEPSSHALLHAKQLKTGELMPDAELLAEDGSRVRLSDFSGNAVAFTFMFTRCPLPDYCPRMNNNFGKARELLLVGEDTPPNWQFISISFDPEFDKPGVLERYAFSYRGGITNRWLFASASSEVLKSMASQVDFRFANEMGSFQHNLRTIVLDTERRVVRQFEGNKWKAEDLTESMIQAAKPSIKAAK